MRHCQCNKHLDCLYLKLLIIKPTLVMTEAEMKTKLFITFVNLRVKSIFYREREKKKKKKSCSVFCFSEWEMEEVGLRRNEGPYCFTEWLIKHCG